ncbi:uncharacterized protein LOC110693546 [Chenopodium quinoa]|uniref:uncharacterized protein LOC110693546 n=1 Tax=Chenopodium quinoa TaxID=63459 RepID=UPI000B7923E0|nr:uncharacterized protein LOC110693546 [Chenopodium quinoa]
MANIDSNVRKKRGRKPLIEGCSTMMIEANSWANTISTKLGRRNFQFVFSESYHSQGIIKVPVDFARKHFQNLTETTKVLLRLYDTNFEAELKVQTIENKIVKCFIKKGVDKLIDYYEVQINEGAVLKLRKGKVNIFDVYLQLNNES